MDQLEIDSLQKAKRVLLKEEGHEEFLYWELQDEKRLYGLDLGEVKELVAYRDSLKLVLGAARYEDAIQKEAKQGLSKSLIGTAQNGDRKNALLVHTGSIGKIRKINFLESQILNYQIKRFPLLGHPTEFHAFIAIHETLGKMRIYFASSDTQWPPKPQILIEELEKEIKQGWQLKYHLHNHYELQANNFIGILAPSLADAQYYKMLSERFQLGQALITNGFYTVVINADEFTTFESH